MKKVIFLILITLSLQAEFIRDDKLNIVIDTERNLIWQDDESINKTNLNWDNAKKHCENLKFAGYSNWRLPKKNELKSIMNDKEIELKNGENSFVNPIFENVSRWYWSLTESKKNSSDAWNYAFSIVDDGDLDYKEVDDIFVLCIKDINFLNIKKNLKQPQSDKINHSELVSESTKIPKLWYKNQYTLIIGIDKYKNKKIDTLSNAVNDAREIEKIFKNLGFKTTSLYNEKATKKNILKEIRKLKNNINSNDSFIIYFAGHGQGLKLENREKRGYIIPYDVSFDLSHKDIMDYNYEAISINTLKDYAKDVKAKHIALLLDSCFSGLAMERRGLVLPKSMNMNYYEDLLNQKAINILTAGDDTPVSDGDNHSPFTKALITAFEKKSIDLEDGDGFATFLELATYVKTKVEKATNRKQKPQFDNLSLEDGDFIFKVR